METYKVEDTVDVLPENERVYCTVTLGSQITPEADQAPRSDILTGNSPDMPVDATCQWMGCQSPSQAIPLVSYLMNSISPSSA